MRRSLGSLLRNALTNVAYTVAGAFNVEVRFGHAPSTDGNIIYLPELPLDVERNLPAPFSSVDQCTDVVRACVLHEGGHCAHTDFKSAGRKRVKTKGGLVSNLYQGIEDARMEGEVISQFRGAKSLLAQGVKSMVEANQIKIPETPAQALSSYVDAYGRHRLNEQEAVLPILERSRAMLLEKLGENGMFKINAYLNTQFWALRSTDDSAVMAEHLIEILKEIEEEQKEEQKQQQNLPQAGQGQPGPNAQATGQGNQGQPDQGDGDSQKGGSQGSAQAESSQDDSKGGPGTGAGNILNETVQDETPLVDYGKAVEAIAQGGTLHDRPVRTPPSNDVPDDRPQYEAARSVIAGEISVLSNRLVAFLMSQRDSGRRIGTRGRLHGPSLARVAVGNPNVFARKYSTREPYSALSILIDASGSMIGAKATESQKLMIMVSAVCAQLDVALEVLAFDSGGVYALKPFETPYQQSLGRIGGYIHVGHGGTPLGDALLQTAWRLDEREEPRKLLFALTDGDTEDGDLTEYAVDLISRSGIEMVGIGIGTGSVQKYFPHNAYVTTQSLGSEVIRILQAHLKTAA
jgi:cobaltochelatase CobT